MGAWEPTVPTDIWDGLESTLGAKEDKKSLAWKWAAAAAVALFLSAGVYKYSSSIGINGSTSAITKTEYTGDARNHKNENTGIKATPESSDMKNPVAAEKHANYNNGVIDHNLDVSSLLVNPTELNRSQTNKTLNTKTIKTGALLESPNDQASSDFQRSIQEDLKLLSIRKAAVLHGVLLSPDYFAHRINTGSFSIYDEYAFPRKINLEKNPKKGLKSYIYGISLGQMQNNLSFSGSSNTFVHRDFFNVQKKHLTAVNSAEIEGFFGKRFASNGWFATLGVRAGQMAARANYEFLRTPATRDQTGNTDNFGNFPIVGYLDAFAAQAKFQTLQKSTAVDVPIGVLKQTDIGKNWVLNTGLTVNPSFLISSEGRTLNYNDLTPLNVQTNWYRKVMIGSSATVGVSRKISSGSIGLQLKGRAFPFNVYKVNSQVKQKPYDFGIALQWIGGLTQ